jgi:predicted dehydrogenase
LKASAATGAALGGAALFGHLGTNFAFAQGAATIKVGVVGCGGRGTGAAGDCANAAPGVVIHALGDVFQNRLDGARKNLSDGLKEKMQVTDDRCFVGFDAYQRVINSGVDLVILATPPGFRPMHVRAAVDAGKHVFMEKPVAVDPVGVRSILASAEIAAQKNLGVVAGTQRRHQKSYVETIKRIHEGAIGDVVSAQCYWNQGGLWMNPRQPGWSDVEWQLRNWLYFTWLSGDHIVEQHVHNLDVINWVLQATPQSVLSIGGRQQRTDPAYGHAYDHFTSDFEYPNGVRVMSMCRQQDGTDSNVSENIIGTKGRANPWGSIRGATNWRFEGESPNPYVQEHTDLIASIREGKPLNEAKRIAESTLTAIMARMSAYTGKRVTWDQAMNSKLDLVPAKLEFGPMPTPEVAIPGKTPLI